MFFLFKAKTNERLGTLSLIDKLILSSSESLTDSFLSVIKTGLLPNRFL